MVGETKMIPKWRKRLRDDNLGKRLLVAAFILVSLALCLHLKEVRIEIPEIDSKAQGYVVAQTDFVIPDEEGTIILRQEASRDVGAVYRIEEKAIEKRLFEFENFLINFGRIFLQNTRRTTREHNTFVVLEFVSRN